MEQYRKLIARRKALKTSVSRKLNTLSGYLKHESLNKIAFEDKKASLQDTLHSLRENLKSRGSVGPMERWDPWNTGFI